MKFPHSPWIPKEFQGKEEPECAIMDFGVGLEKGAPGCMGELKTDFESVKPLDENLDEIEKSILLAIFPEL